MSRSTESRICAEIEQQVVALRERRPDHTALPYVFSCLAGCPWSSPTRMPASGPLPHECCTNDVGVSPNDACVIHLVGAAGYCLSAGRDPGAA